MSELDEFEIMIGLEVHAELKTRTKIFCSCANVFGAEPNTHCCPVCMGLPGSLPSLNRRAAELAVTAGLALNCEISDVCRMDRKQYFYPDLPKAYQITQAEYPVCRNGYLLIRNGETERRVGITRIHLEEDAGKLMHEENCTKIDYNRCGVPLIEIVSAPDLHSGAEAAAYLRELRNILLACGVSDCKMQEGSLRCDVNVSLRRANGEQPGERTELKNLNSFSFVEKAVDFEVHRQTEELKETGRVRRRTMRYDPSSGRTEPMREKEQAVDYRIFPEPDLPPFRISLATVERLRQSLPELPAAKRERLRVSYDLTASEAEILLSIPGLADYFETAATASRYPRIVVGLLLTDLLRLCTEEPFRSPVPANRLAELADLSGDRVVNSSVAKKLLLQLTERDCSPLVLVEQQGLKQINDVAQLTEWIDAVFAENEQSVRDFRNGKKNAVRALQGRLMARSEGRADPVLAERLILEKLKNETGREGTSDV